MTATLKAEPRTVLGKKTKHLRAEGIIPAEVFGHGAENQHVSVAEKDFMKIYREGGENAVIELSIGGEKVSTLVSHVAQDHVSGKVLAIDFHRIKKGEKIRTHVPVEYVGNDMAAKAGFVLVKVTSQLEIEALPENIPHSFQVDISGLQEPGENIEVKDMTLPEGVKLFVAPETVLVTVGEKAKEEIAPAPTEEAEDEEKKEGEEKGEKEEKKEEEK